LEGPEPIPAAYRHIVVEEKDGVLVVRFIGLEQLLASRVIFEQDPSSRIPIEEIGQELNAVVAHRKPCSLILDFEGKSFVFYDVFFSKLIVLFRKVKLAEGTLKLCDLSPGVIEVLVITGLVRLFPLFEHLDDAMAGKALDPNQLIQRYPRPR
jgi:anti-anti-sigma regulatory factor